MISLLSFSSFLFYSARHVIGGDCEGADGVESGGIVDFKPAGETTELLLATPCRLSKLALSCPAATYENTHNIA